MLCRWKIQEPVPGAGNLLDRLLAARGYSEPEAQKAFLEAAKDQLDPPDRLPGVTEATIRILAALKQRERIAIYGDYDVDGVTSTAILMRTLRAIEPTVQVESYIPHRLDEGYGLNVEALESLHASGVDLVITVDCGVAAVAEIARATEIGLELIITDHHPLGEHPIPKVAAVVHPGLPGSAYEWPILSGSAVAWKLSRHLLSQHEGTDAPGPRTKELLKNTLCMAGMGVIADVVPLIGENRRIAAKALHLMKRCSLAGVQAMLIECLKKGETPDSETVGFRIGPRLNAAGRLGHAQVALDLLMTDDMIEAKKIAVSLTVLNKQRQELAKKIEEEACRMTEAAGMDGDEIRMIVLAEESWHPGVVGIVASRLVERYGRPVILLGCAEKGVYRGSGRSIDGFSLHDAVQVCQEHLISGGGHAMAAGLTLHADSIDAARESLVRYANAQLKPVDLIRAITIDCEATLEELTVPLVHSLQQMQPFGRCNESPKVLLRGVRVQQAEPFGDGSHVRVGFEGSRSRGVWFRPRDPSELLEMLPRKATIDVVVEPKLNEWRGATSVDLHIKDLIRR